MREAEANGWSKRGLATAAGVAESVLRNWWTGKRALLPEVERRVAEALRRGRATVEAVGGAPKAAEPAAAGSDMPTSVAQALATLERMAGSERLSDVDLRALARSQTAAGLGTLVRLMIGSKSDTVKLRAAEVLIERGWGKAGKGEGAKPAKAPAEDRDLLAALERITKGGKT